MNTEYPSRLFHKTPSWVSDMAVFHIRIRCEKGMPGLLTNPEVAKALMDSVCTYSDRGVWSCFLFLVMPDHLHGLFSFGQMPGMGESLRSWKRFHARASKIRWQENFFDHRIRDAAEFSEKFVYIERNPVVMGLCERVEDWPWRSQAWHPEARPRF